MAWLPASHLQSARHELQQLMPHFDYASCVPFSNNTALDAPGQERSGLLFRASAQQAPDDALLAQIESVLNLDSPYVLRYCDKKHGQRRAALLQHDATQTTLEAFMLAGDTRAQSWITTLLKDELPADAYGRVLLVPGAQPPVWVGSRGTQVCVCFNVSDVAIEAQLRSIQGTAQERLGSLQSALKCGTNCGSCVPELQRRVRDGIRIDPANRALSVPKKENTPSAQVLLG